MRSHAGNGTFRLLRPSRNAPTRLAWLIGLGLLLGLVAPGCGGQDESSDRNTSGLIDKLDGVWVFPSEQGGRTTVTVIKGMQYKIYNYSSSRIDPKKDLWREGPVYGQEGVYFLPNEASYYSPKFFIESQGRRFLILNKYDYDKYVKHGKIPVGVEIRVADSLDFAKPPERPSIKVLGLVCDEVAPKSP